jgi:hypothetical protein
MLQEARARLVDVETGFEPRPMRSLSEESAPEAGSRTEQPRTVKPPSPQPTPAAAPHRPLPPEASPAPPRIPSPEPSATTLGDDDDTLLWLGDPSDEAAVEPGEGSQDVAPWRRGLRG